MEWIIIGLVCFIVYGYLKEQSGNKHTYTSQSGQIVSEKLQKRQPRHILEIEKPEDFEITPEIREILDKLENTNQNYFLTGKAGTGKSTLLKYFRATTNKNHGVVAPTGIAAINVQGQTIHSFFGFGIDITPSRVKYVNSDKLLLIRNLDMLIIDEISMVRADLLDCIDESLRKNRRNNQPFGGVQIIAIGDPYQLPPVVKTSEMKYFSQIYGGAHFFNAKSYKQGSFTKLELTKIYRQKDDMGFVSILNAIRSGLTSEKHISILNEKTKNKLPSENAIKLVTTNNLARTINNSQMRNIPGDEKLYTALMTGDFKESAAPTEVELVLKEGARVMLLNNDKHKRWVNGDVGTIIGLDKSSVKLKFDDSTYDIIDLHQWDNVKFIYDEETGRIEPEITGKFVQLPLKLAWAVTIHKSQGKTYDHVHIDFGTGTFAPGQAYVALSRCTSLEGLTFEAPMNINDIITDERVRAFMGDEANNYPERDKNPPTTSQSKGVNPIKVSKSDINKMNFFMENPQRYATGSEISKQKVNSAIKTYNAIKDILDDKTIEKFNRAILIYKTSIKD